MGLIKVPVTKRDTEAYSKTYGLNTEKMGNFFVEDGSTVFYYVELENRRAKSMRYETSLSYASLEGKFQVTVEGGKPVAEIKRRLNLRAVAKGVNDETWEHDVNVDIDKIQYIWDSGDYAYVVLDNGAFDTIRYKVEESLDEIIHEFSASESA